MDRPDDHAGQHEPVALSGDVDRLSTWIEVVHIEETLAGRPPHVDIKVTQMVNADTVTEGEYRLEVGQSKETGWTFSHDEQ